MRDRSLFGEKHERAFALALVRARAGVWLRVHHQSILSAAMVVAIVMNFFMTLDAYRARERATSSVIGSAVTECVAAMRAHLNEVHASQRIDIRGTSEVGR